VIGRFFARCADKRLGEDLQGNLVRLFAERSAQIVQNDELGTAVRDPSTMRSRLSQRPTWI
jgi:hypothetical protein